MLGHIICDERPWEKGRISLAVMSRLQFAFWLPQLSPLPSIFSFFYGHIPSHIHTYPRDRNSFVRHYYNKDIHQPPLQSSCRNLFSFVVSFCLFNLIQRQDLVHDITLFPRPIPYIILSQFDIEMPKHLCQHKVHFHPIPNCYQIIIASALPHPVGNQRRRRTRKRGIKVFCYVYYSRGIERGSDSLLEFLIGQRGFEHKSSG